MLGSSRIVSLWPSFSGQYARSGRDMIRPINLRLPRKLPSGYLKDSAPPKSCYICHSMQPFDTQILLDMNEILDKHLMQCQSMPLFRTGIRISAIPKRWSDRYILRQRCFSTDSSLSFHQTVFSDWLLALWKLGKNWLM